MLIFGGRGNSSGIVYNLDLNDMKWSNINDVHYRREGHSANVIANSIYLFGGEKGYYKNDI